MNKWILELESKALKEPIGGSISVAEVLEHISNARIEENDFSKEPSVEVYHSQIATITKNVVKREPAGYSTNNESYSYNANGGVCSTDKPERKICHCDGPPHVYDQSWCREGKFY